MDRTVSTQIQSYLLDYLQKKIPNFQTKGKKGLFTCPFADNHNDKHNRETANRFPPTSYKVHCFDPNCGKLGTIFDICRKLDFGNDPNLTEDDIGEYLVKELNIQTNDTLEKIFSLYSNLGWDLVPIAKGEKNPIEKNWTNKNHKDIREWKQWYDNGLNLGVKTGSISNITVIDIDSKELSDDLKVFFGTTLTQDTKKGLHLIYQYDSAIPTGSFDYNGIHIDVQNDGRQIVIEPSIVDDYKRTFYNETINVIEPNFKEFILSNLLNRKESQVTEDIGIITGLEGNCNNTFIKVLGMFRKFMSFDNVEKSAYLINNNMLDNPMENKTIRSMCQQIEKYHKADVDIIGEKIIEHLKIVETAHVKDLKECLGFDRKDLEKALKILSDHKKIIKIKKDLYKLIEDTVWQEDFLSLGKPLSFKVPYFEDYAYFDNGSLIVIGAPSGYGKTHCAMNMIKQFIDEGIYPYLISTEAGSKFSKVAQTLGLKEGDFGYIPTNNPLHINLKQNSVTILDWLKAPNSEYSKMDSIYGDLNDKLIEAGGILIVLAQLKRENNSFYAENMAEFFASLVAKFLYPVINNIPDNEHPYFKTTKIRDSKVNKQFIDIPLTFDFNTKLLTLR